MNSLQPLGNLVLVEPIEETERNGIALPEKMRETNFAYVRGIGPGTLSKKGVRIAIELQLGEKVMLAPQTTWEDIEVEGHPHRLINANHVLAVME